uniref:Uncharacterized protein n=1 Tax=Nothobranchius furzeri TaxID=105023 RepID=A0A8C6PT91_NOTFU
MKILVVLLLVFFTVEMVQNAFWDYVGKTTMTSKEYVWHIRKSAPGKNLCIEAIYGFFNTVYTQVVLWTNDFYRKFCHEIDNLKYHMEEFMEDLEGGVLFHSTEMAAQLRCKMEDMKKYIAYYIESLDPKGLKECIMGQIQELHGEMYENEHMEEFQGIILLMVNNFEGQLDTTTNEINRKMAPRGKKFAGFVFLKMVAFTQITPLIFDHRQQTELTLQQP